jgi:RHH-type rel operon transcriptional repressor/antitoxin RelB
MDKQTISFRIEPDKLEALDSLADVLDRDRSYLLNEAVAAYLEVQQWQVEQIEKSLRQADAGELVPHKKVKEMAARWRRS